MRSASARDRRPALVVCLGLTLGVAPMVQAQELESPIVGEIEVRFGDYLPDIDSEFSTPGPYEQIFGAGGALLFEVEYSHYLWREIGALGIGFSVGYSSNGGKGLNADGTTSVDSTSFQMVPLRVEVVYRFDYLPRELSVPLVPYVKLGLDATVWWTKSAAGIATYRDPATGQIDEGRGVSFGWHGAAGLQFLLDVLAPSMARTFDASSGVNNTYIFAEFMYADIDNFGSDKAMPVGDGAFMFGLAFEF